MTDYISDMIQLLDQKKLKQFYYNKIYLPDIITTKHTEVKEYIENLLIDTIKRYKIPERFINLFLHESLRNIDDDIANSLKYRILTLFNVIKEDEEIVVQFKTEQLKKQEIELEKIKQLNKVLKKIKLHDKNVQPNISTSIKKFYNISYHGQYLTKSMLVSFFNALEINDKVAFIGLRYDNKMYRKCKNYKDIFDVAINNESIIIFIRINDNLFIELNIKKYTDYFLVFDSELSDVVLETLGSKTIVFEKNENIYNDTIEGSVELFLPGFTELKLYRASLFDHLLQNYIYADETNSSRSISKIGTEGNAARFYFDENGKRLTSSTYFSVVKEIGSYYNVQFFMETSVNLQFFVFIIKYLLTKTLDEQVVDVDSADFIADAEKLYSDPEEVSMVYQSLHQITPSLTEQFIFSTKIISSNDTKIVIPRNAITKNQGYFYTEDKVLYANTIQESEDSFTLTKFDRKLFDLDVEMDDDILMLDYRYTGTFFNIKKQVLLNKTDPRFKNSYARTCNADKQPIVIDEEDRVMWEQAGYSMKSINNFIYACPGANYPVIYMLDMDLPCCGINEMKPKIDTNIVFGLIKNDYKLEPSRTFLQCLQKYMPPQLKRLGEADIRKYIAANYRMEIMAQECYNVPDVKSLLEQDETEFDSFYFYKIMELILKCNIFILKGDGFEIPNHSNYHVREINNELPCMFIFKRLKKYYPIVSKTTKSHRYNLSKQVAAIYRKFGYMLRRGDSVYKNPTMYYNWNFILRGHELISQKLNSSGRVYAVDIKFIDSADVEHAVTLFVPETYPLYTKEDPTIYVTTEDVCMELIGVPALIRKSGYFYNLGDLEHSVFIPCKTKVENNDVVCENYNILRYSQQTYDINLIGDVFNYALFFVKLLIFAKTIEKDTPLSEWRRKYIQLYQKNEDIDYTLFRYHVIEFPTTYIKTSGFIRDVQRSKKFPDIIKNNKIHVALDIYRKFEYNILNPILNTNNVIIKDLVSSDLKLFYPDDTILTNVNYEEVLTAIDKFVPENFLLSLNDSIYKGRLHKTERDAIQFGLRKNGLLDIIYYFKGEKRGERSFLTNVRVESISTVFVEVDDASPFLVDDTLYGTTERSEVRLGRIKSIVRNRIYFFEKIRKEDIKTVYYKMGNRSVVNPQFESQFDRLMSLVVVMYDSSLKPIQITSKYQTAQSVNGFVANSDNIYISVLLNKTNYYSLVLL